LDEDDTDDEDEAEEDKDDASDPGSSCGNGMDDGNGGIIGWDDHVELVVTFGSVLIVTDSGSADGVGEGVVRSSASGGEEVRPEPELGDPLFFGFLGGRMRGFLFGLFGSSVYGSVGISRGCSGSFGNGSSGLSNLSTVL